MGMAMGQVKWVIHPDLFVFGVDMELALLLLLPIHPSDFPLSFSSSFIS